jgi:diguanylate cyclase (GGDEF)-like protein
VVVTSIRFSVESVADGYALLYVLPIAVAALAFGLAGGVGAAALAMTLVVVWGQLDDVGLSVAGYLTRGLTFFLLGALVGFETAQRRRFQAERERLLARVEAMARTDELTGLANRRAWGEELRREMERSRRSGDGAFAVALLDLDRFKQYNDRFGHPGGDQLLIRAASEWRVRLRLVDTLARYGGEEFAVLLPGCPPENAIAIVDRLRGATPMGQTVSGGIAYWDGNETAEALIERADKALYEAKRGGRDRCVIAEPA